MLLQDVDDIVAGLADELVTDPGNPLLEDAEDCVAVIDEAIRTCDGGRWWTGAGIAAGWGDIDRLEGDLADCTASLDEKREAAAQADECQAGLEGCESDFAALTQTCAELQGNYTSLNVRKFNYDDVTYQAWAYEELSAGLLGYQGAVIDSTEDLTEKMDSYREKIAAKWNLDGEYDELRTANEDCENTREVL